MYRARSERRVLDHQREIQSLSQLRRQVALLQCDRIHKASGEVLDAQGHIRRAEGLCLRLQEIVHCGGQLQLTRLISTDRTGGTHHQRRTRLGRGRQFHLTQLERLAALARHGIGPRQAWRHEHELQVQAAQEGRHIERLGCGFGRGLAHNRLGLRLGLQRTIQVRRAIRASREGRLQLHAHLSDRTARSPGQVEQ